MKAGYYDDVKLPDLAHTAADPRIRAEKEFLSPLLQGLDLLKNAGLVDYWFEREYISQGASEAERHEQLAILPNKCFKITVDMPGEKQLIDHIDDLQLKARYRPTWLDYYETKFLLNRHQLLQLVSHELLRHADTRTERREIEALQRKIDSIPELQSERSTLSKLMDTFRGAGTEDLPPPVKDQTDLHYSLSKETWTNPNYRRSEALDRIIEPDSGKAPSDKTLADRFAQEWKNASSGIEAPYNGPPDHARAASLSEHAPARNLLQAASEYTGIRFK